MFYKSQKWMLIVSFLIHLILLVSIFDIYFKSPIVEGITPQINDVPVAAKRLVLFVGDGLRADSFFEFNEGNIMPAQYLREIIEKRGRWGVSHTRVPTESRPGHVAMIAGIYEDPSAIFKGWKDNPIEFDSVFNQSFLTFGWGSPDVLSIFNKDSKKSNIITETYPSSWEEFSGKIGSATRLSLWSFENFRSFLMEAKSNHTIYKRLNNRKIIFFLHLLGIDTAGHSDKPHSEEYTENIRIADKIVRETEILINEFYEYDNATVYIFASDHGMTDWGSHGEGSISETETPFVAWGAGISKPEINYQRNHSPVSWNLNKLLRTDLKQADITPLISVLLGLSIPVHSIGVLPLNILDFTQCNKSAAILLNARQILAQFVRKRKLIENDTLCFLYRPYEQLLNGKEVEIINLLEVHFQKGYYDEVIKGSMDLISICLLGLDYYHNYYQKLLLFCISASYIGWIFWLLLSVLPNDSLTSRKSNRIEISKKTRLLILNIFFIFLIIASIILLFVQFLPTQYYLYCCLPSIVWWNVLKKLITSNLTTEYNKLSCSFMFTLVGTIIGTELVVMSFFERRTLSVVIFMLLFWPILNKENRCSYFSLNLMWIFSCFSLMIFPFLPVLGGKPNNMCIILSFSIWFIFIFISRTFLMKKIKRTTKLCSRLIEQFFFPNILFGIALINVLYVTYRHFAKEGLLYVNQFLSWLILILVPIYPLFSSRKLITRLLNIYFSLGVVSILFALNHDALFVPLFSFHVFIWLLMEAEPDNYTEIFSNSPLLHTTFSECHQIKNRRLKQIDFRRAFFFFFYTVFSFFATGNIASINSFDILWVRCFITLFAPFTMTILILLKITIPFFITACTFRAINGLTKIPVDKMFFIVLVYCDIMGLNFLFLVKNVGSWLEIGSSVSHYVISQTIILILVLLYSLSSYLTCIKIKDVAKLYSKFKHFTLKYID